jgi:hypothetical protein
MGASVMLMLALLLLSPQLADGAASAASNSNATSSAQSETGAEFVCTDDKKLCLTMTATGDADTDILAVTITSSDGVATTSVTMPASITDYNSVSVWPQIIPLSGGVPDVQGNQSALIGIITHQSTMYSGGGGASRQLHLFRIGYRPGTVRLGDELAALPLYASLLIRACFTEADYNKSGEACHDDYQYNATVSTVAKAAQKTVQKSLQNGASSGDWPALYYQSIATAYPRRSRRSKDNSTNRNLRKSDLVHWKDTKCSYSRTLRYNPATKQYTPTRPEPDCSDWTEI